MSIVRQTVKRVMGSMLPSGRLLLHGECGDPASQSINGQRVSRISLTFDDGPHPEWTPPILDALDEAGWIGTFFLIGREAEAYPELVREIVERGHEIGNHSYFHGEPCQTSVRMFVDSVLRTKELFTELTEKDITLMRPPKGRLDLWKTRSLWRSGHTVVLWNIDTKDFEMSSTEEADRWADAYDPTGGDIVLLHDRLPYAAEIVRTLARKHGDTLLSVSVSEWLGNRPQSTFQSSLQAVGNLFVS